MRCVARWLRNIWCSPAWCELVQHGLAASVVVLVVGTSRADAPKAAGLDQEAVAKAHVFDRFAQQAEQAINSGKSQGAIRALSTVDLEGAAKVLLEASSVCREATREDPDPNYPWPCKRDLQQKLDLASVLLMESGSLSLGARLCDAAENDWGAKGICQERRQQLMAKLQFACDGCEIEHLYEESNQPAAETLRHGAWVRPGRWRIVVRYPSTDQSASSRYEATVEVTQARPASLQKKDMTRLPVPLLALDGQLMPPAIVLGAGTHRVSIHEDKEGQSESTATVTSPAATVLRPRALFVWSSVAAGFATAASGIALVAKQIEANREYKKYEEQRQAGDSGDALDARKGRLSDARGGRDLAANFFYATSGVLLVSCIALVADWAVGRREADKRDAPQRQGVSAMAAAFASPAAAGVAVDGRF